MAAFGGGSVLSSTLQDITSTKLQELSKRRSEYEDRRSRVTQALAQEAQPIKRLQILNSGVKSCFGIAPPTDENDAAGHEQPTTDTRAASADYHSSGLGIQLDNLDLFISQARYDPSVSADMARRWEESLLKHLDMRSLKFQYASLYAQLVTEWLSSEKSGKKAQADADDDVGMRDHDVDEDDFEDLSHEAKKQSREAWEQMVFTEAQVDEAALQEYLKETFGVADPDDDTYPGHRDALKALHEHIKQAENDLALPNQFSTGVLHWVCSGLIASGSLSDEKRQVLQDFRNNPIIMSEVADVLNMRMQSLETWSWGSDGVNVDQERQLNGVYNISMREDLLQSLLLYYIGVKWSVLLKNGLRTYRKAKDGAWVSPFRRLDRRDRERRRYYLGPERRMESVQALRDQVYRKHYFLTALKSSETERFEVVAGEEEAECEEECEDEQFGVRVMQLARKASMPAPVQQIMVGRSPGYHSGAMKKKKKKVAAARFLRASTSSSDSSSSDSGDDDDSDVDTEAEDDIDENPNPNLPRGAKNLSAAKQRLLRLLSTEIVINTKLYGGMTAIHSVFDSWNSNLPHQTALGVLTFLGVSKKWLGFFHRFLATPLKFATDGPEVSPQARRRGTPSARVLSDVFGETTLFCLDLAVNRATNGRQLWRLQDEFWFWSRDTETASTAWAAVQKFEKITSTNISRGKSGSVCIDFSEKDHNSSNTTTRNPDISSLPRGDIRWGFLRLSPATGMFEIDQAVVDKHIADLRRQLYGKRGSIIAFIQAWNTYATTFFTHNFGKPANCFGRQHVEQMLATHGRVQREVFAPQDPPTVSLTGRPQQQQQQQQQRPPGTSGGCDTDIGGAGDGAKEQRQEITSMVDFIKSELACRFSVTDVPDAYLFFPTDLGGLDLRSPFISILQVHKTVLADPRALLVKYLEDEQKAHRTLQGLFEDGKHSGGGGGGGGSGGSAQRSRVLLAASTPGSATYAAGGDNSAGGGGGGDDDDDDDDKFKFIPFDEFVKHREDLAPSSTATSKTGGFRGLGDVYRQLLRLPREQGGVQKVSRAVSAAMSTLDGGGGGGGGVDGGITSNFYSMQPYWRWIVAMYGPEVVDRFGGLHIVEPGLLPMGMVRMFRERKVQWETS